MPNLRKVLNYVFVLSAGRLEKRKKFQFLRIHFILSFYNQVDVERRYIVIYLNLISLTTISQIGDGKLEKIFRSGKEIIRLLSVKVEQLEKIGQLDHV